MLFEAESRKMNIVLSTTGQSNSGDIVKITTWHPGFFVKVVIVAIFYIAIP